MAFAHAWQRLGQERHNLNFVGDRQPIPGFQPLPLIRNGHAMTIAAAYWPRRFALSGPEPRLFRVAEDSQLLAACHWQEGRRKECRFRTRFE